MSLYSGKCSTFCVSGSGKIQAVKLTFYGILASFFCSPPLSRPEYLLTQSSTSRCQTSEFSGFNTHWSLSVNSHSSKSKALTWFSSGKANSLLGTPLDCSTLNAARPSEMGSL